MRYDGFWNGSSVKNRVEGNGVFTINRKIVNTVSKQKIQHFIQSVEFSVTEGMFLLWYSWWMKVSCGGMAKGKIDEPGSSIPLILAC